MKTDRIKQARPQFLAPRKTVVFLSALVLCGGVYAQALSSASDMKTAAGFIADVDRQDLVNLAHKPVSTNEVGVGLFPEDAESAEARKLREQCDRLIEAGFKCMAPSRTYVRYSLPGVNFAHGSAVLPDGMKQQLSVFADVLRGRAGAAAQIRIDGHADATGSAEGNIALSKMRAESVRGYLVSLGVSPSLFTVVGQGSNELLNKKDPAAAENRRVEIARNLGR